jgi:hypothetical protein
LIQSVEELNPVADTRLKLDVEVGPSVIVLFTNAAREFYQNTDEPFIELFPVTTF